MKQLDERWTTMTRIDTMGRKRTGSCCVIGARFDKCVVIASTSGTRGVGRTTLECDCKTIFAVDTRAVRRGQVARCMGCAAKDTQTKRIVEKGHHVMVDYNLRQLWLRRRTGIISRCYNPDAKAYPNYGGRGIILHQEWIDSKQAWLEYAMTLPNWSNTNTDLDRENNDGNYEPGNIRLTTRKINTNNRRTTVKLEYKGRTVPYTEFRALYTPKWARNTLAYHLTQGRTPEQCIAQYQKTLTI